MEAALDDCSVGSRLSLELEIALPEPAASLDQDAEWCVVRVGDSWRRIRFHDYQELFSVPGLYEEVIYRILQCSSPQVVTDLLAQAAQEEDKGAHNLRVLDLGAGNGIVGELLAKRGAELVVGIDIIDEAAEATERDRPGVYDNFHVADLSNLTHTQHRELSEYRFDCLVCVAALGFGDIPVEVFKTAYNLVEIGGWIAFNIKEEFLESRDPSGFADLIHTITRDEAFEIRRKSRYIHRLGTDRDPIHYVAFAGRKRGNIS